MTGLIDNNGRLFGRINLVDAVIGGFALLLVPLAYATYLLFQPPAPTIDSVEPAPLTSNEERAAQGTPLAGKFKIRGSGLRPVLRARVGSVDAVAFIFEDPSAADVLVGEVPAGTHDLVLFDGVQEVARVGGAITIPEAPPAGIVRVALAGRLLDVDPAALAALHVGAKFPSGPQPRVEVLALGEPHPATIRINTRAEVAIEDRQHRRALLSLRCETIRLQPRECAVGGQALVPGVTFIVPEMPNQQRFMIDEIVPATPPVTGTLRLQLIGFSEVLDLVKIGDVDQPELAIDQRGAIIRQIGRRRVGLDRGFARLAIEIGAASATVASVPDAAGSLDVVVTAGLDAGSEGWRYRGEPVRPGGPFLLVTPRYQLRATVLDVDVDQAPASHPK